MVPDSVGVKPSEGQLTHYLGDPQSNHKLRVCNLSMLWQPETFSSEARVQPG